MVKLELLQSTKYDQIEITLHKLNDRVLGIAFIREIRLAPKINLHLADKVFLFIQLSESIILGAILYYCPYFVVCLPNNNKCREILTMATAAGASVLPSNGPGKAKRKSY